MEYQLENMFLQEEICTLYRVNTSLSQQLSNIQSNVAFLETQLCNSQEEVKNLTAELCASENKNAALLKKESMLQEEISTLMLEFQANKEKHATALSEQVENLKRELEASEEQVHLLKMTLRDSAETYAKQIAQIKAFSAEELSLCKSRTNEVISTRESELNLMREKCREADNTIQQIKAMLAKEKSELRACKSENCKLQSDYEKLLKEQDLLTERILTYEKQQPVAKEILKKQLMKIEELTAKNKDLQELNDEILSRDSRIPQLDKQAEEIMNIILQDITYYRDKLSSDHHPMIDKIIEIFKEMLHTTFTAVQQRINQIGRCYNHAEISIQNEYKNANASWKAAETSFKCEIARLQRELDALKRDTIRSQKDKRRK
jgi:hypothetical protein